MEQRGGEEGIVSLLDGLARVNEACRRIAGAMVLFLAQACGGGNGGDVERGASVENDFTRERARMVEEQIAARGIEDANVLRAMRVVKRHRFAPELSPATAYADRAAGIGHQQTISQPYVVARMSEAARLRPPCRVLEVGTGSGYQAAVLAEMGCEVWSVEIVEPLARRAREVLAEQGYADRVHVRAGDGYRGWPEAAPFDAVLVTAAAPRVPKPLLDQLEVGARLVIPVGEPWQTLEVHRRTASGFEKETLDPVRFVPMTGEIREPREDGSEPEHP